MTNRRRPGTVHLGFVPLIDAAPLIAAHEMGYFADEGLKVTLERQIGWGNVRDKLCFGHLDASHALVGMPLASQIHPERFIEPLVALMALGSGGNAITLCSRLADQGINSGSALARYVRLRRSTDPGAAPLILGHVFACSMHHYLLREWLARWGMEPDLDVRLCIVPPPQMARQMQAGALDGFCVGEPWNTLAEREGWGRIVAATTDIVPDHPEKVLAVSRRWLSQHSELATPLVRAVLRGCQYCAEPRHMHRLAEILSRRGYLDASAETVEVSLNFDRASGIGPQHRHLRGADWCARSFETAATFPSCTHSAWLAEQMIRWGHAEGNLDVTGVAKECVVAAHYREAAAALGLPAPSTDFPPMRLREGWYDPAGTGLAQVNL